MTTHTANLPMLTEDLPGIGGRIKASPDDFLVEELPLYEPAGHGEHLMLFVEKRRQTTSDAIRRIAKAFKVKQRDIGYAGMKDKHAITRQHFTVHRPKPDEDAALLQRMEHTPITVLWAERHLNKLKRGHLKGNRFVIFVRDVEPSKVVLAKRIIDVLADSGIPNFLGEQRFGYRQDNHRVGRCLLQQDWQKALDIMLGEPRDDDSPWGREARPAYERGDYRTALEIWPKQMRHERQALDALRQGKRPQQAVRMIDRRQLDFMVSGFQSDVFNQVLAQRVQSDTLDRLLPGDLAWKHDSRAVFAVDEATAQVENAPDGRVATFDVSPSGPMWGAGMTQATDMPGQIEADALAATGITPDMFEQAGDVRADGSRRPLRVRISNIDISGGVDEAGGYVRVAFDLPRGSFATVALREIIKSDRGA